MFLSFTIVCLSVDFFGYPTQNYLLLEYEDSWFLSFSDFFSPNLLFRKEYLLDLLDMSEILIPCPLCLFLFVIQFICQ